MNRREFLRLGGAGLAGTALLGSGALAGCGGSSTGSGGITVASWDVASDALRDTIPLFKKKRPGTDVSMQSITIDYQQLVPRLQAGDGAPDVFSLAQQDFQNFLMRFPGEFVDVTDRMERYTSQFAEAPLSHASKDGKLFAVPWDMGPVGLWYRRDLFEKAGITPDDVATYDGFIEAGKQLEQSVGGGNEDDRLRRLGRRHEPLPLPHPAQPAGRLFLRAGRQDRLYQREELHRHDLLDRFVTEDIAVDTPTYDEISRAISNGDAATDMGAAWDVGLIKSAGGEAQKGKWDVMPLPAFVQGGPREATLSGSVLVISSQTQNEDAAWDFIEQALLTREGQSKSWAQGLFPSWEPYWETDAFNEPDPYFGFAVAPKFAEIARNVPALDYGPHFLDFQKPLMDAYSAVLTGDTPPQEAMAAAEERAASASGLKVA
jgi:lactose/L-arabinose transport system substrate-binding protein